MLRSSQHIRPIWSRNFHQTTTLYGKQLLRKLRDDDIDPLTIRKHQQQQQQQRRNQRKKPSEEFETKSTTSYNLKGALKVLQNQYDSVTFRDPNNNKPIDIQKLTTQQIKYSSPISKLIFKNLMQVKKLSGRQINRNLALALLGTDGKQLQDSYYICENVKELLKIDNDIERAMYLCQISDKNCSIVGSNEILQWLLSKGKINQALKLFSKRKSSGIPTNLQTYVILFHGIAKAIPWGDDNQQKQQGSTIVNEELFNRVEKIFKNWRLELATNSSSSSSSSSKTVPIEVFNACLSVLVKDFRDEQVRAWDFFNELMANPKENLQSINPDSKTFTIFLKGIKKYFDNEMEKIMINNNSPTISNNERIIRLLDIEAGHIKTSQKIFERAKQLALPPLPTTSNNGDPELDSFNIHKWNKEKIELDSPLIVSYVSLLCNGGGGGGIITNSTTTNSKIKIKIKPPIGSHYLYNEKALSILKQSSPEIDSLLKFVQQVIGEQEEGKDIDTDNPIIAKKSFKSRIDRKINLAIEQAIQSNIKLKFNDKIKNLDPYKIANLINDKNFNPEVIMPTKNSKNFNGLQPVPLIDFTREIGRANNHGMTKFLLMPLFDSLTNMGKLNEFVIAFWYAMIKWGGLRINLSIFNNNNNNNNNNNTTTTTRNVLNGVIKDSETLSVSNMAAGKKLDRSVIDEVILGIFINKITEYGREKGLTKTHLIMELFQTLISKDLNPPPPSLVGKDKDKDRIQIQFKYLMRTWWAIHDDLEYYHAYNQNNNNNNNNSNNNNNKVDDKDLRFIQLEQFLKNLIIFNDINYQWSRNLLMKKLIPDEFIDQINRILIRLNHLNWFNIGNENENENKKIYLYKLMLKSSIKLLIPQRFITAKKNGNGNTNTNTNTLVVVSTYPKLMEQEIFRYIFVKLSKTDNLTDNNIKLLMALKKYRKAKPYNDEEAEKLFKETTNAIYDAIEIGDTKLTKSDIKEEEEEEEENKVSG